MDGVVKQQPPQRARHVGRGEVQNQVSDGDAEGATEACQLCELRAGEGVRHAYAVGCQAKAASMQQPSTTKRLEEASHAYGSCDPTAWCASPHLLHSPAQGPCAVAVASVIIRGEAGQLQRLQAAGAVRHGAEPSRPTPPADRQAPQAVRRPLRVLVSKGDSQMQACEGGQPVQAVQGQLHKAVFECIALAPSYGEAGQQARRQGRRALGAAGDGVAARGQQPVSLAPGACELDVQRLQLGAVPGGGTMGV